MPSRDTPPVTRAVILRGTLFTLAVVLGAVAVWLIVTGTTNPRRIEIGVLAGLWGLLIGAYSMFGARRGHHDVFGSTDVAVRAQGGLEPAAQAEARRAFEQRLEQLLRTEISASVSREVGELRSEVAALRQELVEKVGGQLRLERIETTRLIGSDLEALQAEVRQLKTAGGPANRGLGIPSGFVESPTETNGPITSLRSVTSVTDTPAEAAQAIDAAAAAERESTERARIAAKEAAEKAAREDAERAQREQAERDKAQRERAERERVAREQAERERIKREQAERERVKREQAERERTEREQAQRERAEREKALREKAERERAEREKAAREKAERERAEREQAERERAGREKAARERAERERAGREKAEREKAEREKAAREKAEREKAAREKAEREKAEREKAAREKAEREKAERERAEREKAQREQAEREQAERAAKESQPAAGVDPNDPFADLPRITPFTEFELDPIDSPQVSAINGSHAADGEGSSDGKHGATYSGRRRASDDVEPDDRPAVDNGRHAQRGAHGSSDDTVGRPRGRRRRRDDDDDDGMDILSNLLSRDSGEY